MKIREIQIDRFGAWQDLRLPLHGGGLTVVHGPNEAGKSTLMRFIGGILYGFDPAEPQAGEDGPAPDSRSGGLLVDHCEQGHEIRRTAEPGRRGTLTISGLEPECLEEDWLSERLGGTPKKIFEHVFAVGLHEIQELATLQDDEIARHIYGMTLGPEGQKLLEISADLNRRRSRLFDGHAPHGPLREDLVRDGQLAEELHSAAASRDRHAELDRERRHLEDEIADAKNRLEEGRRQLDGHRFLERVWKPWNQVRELQAELDQLPNVAEFPQNGLERLAELDHEIESATRVRETLLAEADRFRQQAETLEIDPEIRRHEAVIRDLLDQRSWMAELERQQAELRGEIDGRKAELDERLAELGSDWTADRLAEMADPATIGPRLLRTARRYQNALSLRARLRRLCQRKSNASQQRMAALKDRLKELGDGSLEESLDSARKTLAALGDLGRLRLRETELEKRQRALNDELQRLEDRPALPRWVYGVLGFFAVTGIILAVLGIVSGLSANIFAGIVYALLGTACGGTSWAMKTYIESAVPSRDQLQDELREVEIRLRETRQAIARLNGADAEWSSRDPAAGQTDLIRQAAERVAELEQLAATQRGIQDRRRKLSELRSRLQEQHREVTAVRRHWCELLADAGLPETVKIREAFQAWTQIAEAQNCWREWRSASETLRERQRLLDHYHRRIERIADQITGSGSVDDPLALLAEWEQSLRDYDENRTEQDRLRREETGRREEAEEYQERIDGWHRQRSALLAEGGAANAEEFERRAEWAERRQELQDYLELAESELHEAADAEPELAVVEDDLRAYDPDVNRSAIERLQGEIDRLENDLQNRSEDLDRVRREIQDLEEDRRPPASLFEKARTEDRLKEALEEWCALQIAGRAVQRMRRRFEREHQPATLAAASQFLGQLTGGKYHKVWAPLDERRLVIDDLEGRSVRVEQLSGGTREQLFLALRLALVREFTRSGIELPLALDDVLVNFDESRTEFAVQTLMSLAEQGQQILLFTCHMHLAQLFQNRGVEPVWLPGTAPPPEQRLAG